MPYKHIAAHLKKTELACRLHYHQLSHGSHRRKRTGSTSTASSNSSASSKHTIHQYQLPMPHDDRTGFQTPMHGSPNTYHQTSPEQYRGVHQSPNRGVQHKVLLPKPRTITPDESPNGLHGLRIDTSPSGMQQSSVDADRLHSRRSGLRSA